jgi:hypothetical protein
MKHDRMDELARIVRNLWLDPALDVRVTDSIILILQELQYLNAALKRAHLVRE